jgi:3-dehydroquinate synthase
VPICAPDCAETIEDVLLKNALPSAVSYAPGELLPVMLRDKKRAGDEVTLVLPQKIGRCVLHRMPVSELGAFLAAGMKGRG